MLQSSFTVPLNPAKDATTKLNFALSPAFMVCEVDDPAGPTIKSSPVPDRLADCGLPGAVSAIETLAVREPPAFGANVTFTMQLPATDKELPQLLV